VWCGGVFVGCAFVYIYTHTHTHKEKENEKESSFVEGFLHSHPVVLPYRKTYKRDTLFLQNAQQLSLSFSYKTANKKDLFSPLSCCLKEITKEFVPSDCTFPLFFVLFFPYVSLPPKEKTLHNL
jgi:hypothetical protein